MSSQSKAQVWQALSVRNMRCYYEGINPAFCIIQVLCTVAQLELNGGCIYDERSLQTFKPI
jgi:hypothetical protein